MPFGCAREYTVAGRRDAAWGSRDVTASVASAGESEHTNHRARQDPAAGKRSSVLLRSLALAAGLIWGVPGTAFAVGEVADFTYTYDYQGNVLSRVDTNNSLTESFCYDKLNRLTGWDDDSACAGGDTAAYDSAGNVTQKSGVASAYTYPSATAVRPHAVSQVTGTVYGLSNPKFRYDNNGNLDCVYTGASCDSGAPRQVVYTAFNMVSEFKSSSTTTVMAFTYDAGNSRVKMVDTTGTATTTYYLNDPISGLRAEKTVVSGTTTWKDHLQAGGRMTGQRSKVGAAAATFQHFVLDHLGSVAVTTDAEGNNVCRLRYDPWGKRVGSAACSPTTRGFTDHEMIDAWGLVNMNARVYDATLGRFMSVDPITATQFDPQSLNKYSYVSNNPLRFIDPTGMVAEVLVTAPISANTPPPKIGQGYVDVGGYHQGRGYSDKKEVFNNKATANYMALNKQWGENRSTGAGRSAQGGQGTGAPPGTQPTAPNMNGEVDDSELAAFKEAVASEAAEYSMGIYDQEGGTETQLAQNFAFPGKLSDEQREEIELEIQIKVEEIGKDVAGAGSLITVGGALVGGALAQPEIIGGSAVVGGALENVGGALQNPLVSGAIASGVVSAHENRIANEAQSYNSRAAMSSCFMRGGC